MKTDRPFYVTGGTLPGDTPSYVPRHADQDLLNGLIAGEFCYVLNTRQMGKSSLMVRTAGRLEELGATAVVLDLTALGQNLTVEQWYDGLLNLVGRALGLEDELDEFWLAERRLGPMHRWMTALREVVLPQCPGPIVLFIDEIDVVRSLPFSTDEFFAGIRECYNLRVNNPEMNRLTFCLIGVATPAELIRDPRMTPFNIGRRVDLTDFTELEAGALAQGLFPREEPTPRNSAGRALLSRVFYWTGGHPYLTQRLCQAVAREIQAGKSNVRRGTVDRLCHELFLTRRAQERDDNLTFVRDRILHGGTELAVTLDLYAKIRSGRRIKNDSLDSTAAVLLLSGAVRPSGGHLAVRNRIYARVFDARWIEDHLPGTELRRQKAAYQRGLLRAGSVAFAVLAIMAVLVMTAVSYAQRADQSRRYADNRTDEARQMANQLSAALNEKTRALAAKEDALRKLSAALRAKAEETDRAENEKRSAQAARTLAIANSHRAEEQSRVAQQKTEESRKSLTRLSIEAGVSLEQSEDAYDALLWFAEARRLDGKNPVQDRINDLRFELALSHLPCLVQTWWSRYWPWIEAGTGVFGFLPDESIAVDDQHDIRAWSASAGRGAPLLPKAKPDERAVALSPGGRFMLTASPKGSARLWDTVQHRAISPLLNHGCPVIMAGISEDGSRVCTVCRDKTVHSWDPKRGTPILLNTGVSDTMNAMDISRDGRYIAFAFSRQWISGALQVWDAATGRPYGDPYITSNAGINSVRFSPDGKRVAVAPDKSRTVLLRAGSSPPEFVAIADIAVNKAVFSPNGQRVATIDQKDAQIWDSATGRQIIQMRGHRGPLTAVAFSPDGRRLACGDTDGAVRIWDAETGEAVSPFLKYSTIVWDIAFSASGRYLKAAYGDNATRLWDLAGMTSTARELLPQGGGLPFRFSPDGRRIMSDSSQTQVKVWDAATGRAALPSLNLRAPVHDAGFSPDGRRIVTVSDHRRIQLWDARTGKPIGPPLNTDEPVLQALFRPDGKSIVTTSSGAIQVWDLIGHRRIGRPLRLRTALVNASLSPNGQYIGGQDEKTRVPQVWDLAAGEQIVLPVSRPSFLSFGRDSDRVLTLADLDNAQVFDLRTRKVVVRTPRHSFWLTDGAFSPDGRCIATACLGGYAQIWDAATSKPVSPPLRHRASVWFLRFSPDGRLLATLGGDDTCRLWEAATGAPVATIQGISPWRALEFSPDGRRLVAGNRLFDLPDGRRPATEALRLAEVLSCQRIDPRFGPVPLDVSMQRDSWENLRMSHPSGFHPTASQTAAWQFAEIDKELRVQNGQAALSALDRLIALEPDNLNLMRRRADVLAELGDYRAAAAAYARCMPLKSRYGKPESDVAYSCALALLAAGDQAGYRALCVRVRRQMEKTGDRQAISWLAWTECLAPGVPADHDRDIPQLEAWAKEERQPGDLLLFRSACLFRAGRYNAAIRGLNDTIAADSGSIIQAYSRFFLAMAHHRLGHKEEGKTWLKEAVMLADQDRQASPKHSWIRTVLLELLQHEAETLLRSDAG